METKVRVSVGTTLNLGDFNSARVTIEIEKNYIDKSAFPEDEPDLIDKQVAELYAQAEDQLVHKMAALINRLESEGYVGG